MAAPHVHCRHVRPGDELFQRGQHDDLDFHDGSGLRLGGDAMERPSCATASMYYALGSIALLVIGGLSGVFTALFPWTGRCTIPITSSRIFTMC